MKLEGNPDHPVNHGALCGRGQASLQGLYNPDRFAGPLRRDGDALRSLSWDDALKLFAEKVSAARGAGKARGHRRRHPAGERQRGVLADRFVQALGARPRVTLEPFGYEAIRAANRQTFGRDAIPYYALQDAEVVISVRRRLRGDVAVQRRRRPRLRADAHLPRRSRRHVLPRRAAPVPDGLQRRRVDPQRARHRGRHRAGHRQG